MRIFSSAAILGIASYCLCFPSSATEYSNTRGPDFISDNIKDVFEISNKWVVMEADENEEILIFRRYGYEPPSFRNFFVLTCYRSGDASLEVIPPKSKLENLYEITGTNELKGDIYFSIPHVTATYPGVVDMVAATINVPKSSLDSLLEFINAMDYNVYFMNKKFSYKLKDSFTVQKQLVESFKEDKIVRSRGHSQFFGYQDVVLSCLRFSKP